jgi:predicted transcriptional regulator
MSEFFSTRQAAKKLGITAAALSKYISSGKIPPPAILQIGGKNVHSWTEQQIEAVRKLLPKIANGRKTWREKKRHMAKKSRK